eukprot:2693861-Pyramimonas_sp.AAC.1
MAEMGAVALKLLNREVMGNGQYLFTQRCFVWIDYIRSSVALTPDRSWSKGRAMPIMSLTSITSSNNSTRQNF